MMSYPPVYLTSLLATRTPVATGHSFHSLFVANRDKTLGKGVALLLLEKGGFKLCPLFRGRFVCSGWELIAVGPWKAMDNDVSLKATLLHP